MVVLLVGFVSAASVFDVELTKYNYSVGSNFQGNITINDSSVLVSEILSGDISSCGAYDEKEITIYDLLINSGEVLGPSEVFSAGADSTSHSMSLEDNSSALVGFRVGGPLSAFSFSISGTAAGVKFDVGADGDYDWGFVGDTFDWGTLMQPHDYEGSIVLEDALDDTNPKLTSVCNEFDVSLDEFSSELKVKVQVYAKQTIDGGKLEAKIEGKTCEFTSVAFIYGPNTCEITLDAGDLDSNILEACIITADDDFLVPRNEYRDVSYYYMGLQKGIYDNTLSSSPVVVSNLGLLNAMDSFCSEDCFIPVEVSVVEGGSISLTDAVVQYGGSSNDKFYSVSSTTLEVDLSNKTIPLNSFIDLKTPIVEDREDCILKLEFGSDDDSVGFGVSAGPTSIIEVSSVYMAKDYNILFDGSDSIVGNNRTIVSYNWDFGDNTTGLGERVSHKYTYEGNYTVVLTVKDSTGIVGSSSINVFIVPLEEHLENQFTRLDSGVVSALSLNSLVGEEKSFYDFMGYGSLINISVTRINSLESNFTSLKAGNASNKNSQYVLIVNELQGIVDSLPVLIHRVSSRDIDNLVLFNPDEIFNYGGVSSYTTGYVNELFKFNVDNVDVDMNSTLFSVDFFEGSSNFLRVEKDISIIGGTNIVIVEDLRDVVVNLDNSVGGTPRNGTKVLTWTGGVNSIDYVVETDALSNIKTIVFVDLEIEGDNTYCFNDSSCEFYCGDGICTIANYLNVDEKNDLSVNYCSNDCGNETPKILYISLLIVFGLFVLYILFYRGPGSLNKKISPKKVSVSEKDRAVLNGFIYNSLNRGYTKEQVKNALVKKGWSADKVNLVLKEYLREKLKNSVK